MKLNKKIRFEASAVVWFTLDNVLFQNTFLQFFYTVPVYSTGEM
jgi:hypothetical protein